jgi:hypothetical protein
MAVFKQAIFTQSSNGVASGITFNNIPQGFTDLELVISYKDAVAATSGSYYLLYVNNETDNLYSMTFTLFSTTDYGSSVVAATNIWYPYWGIVRMPGANAVYGNGYSNGHFYFPNYSGGTYKTYVGEAVNANSNTSYIATEILGGTYRSTKPITRIDIAAPAVINADATFTLYGISNNYASSAPNTPTSVVANDNFTGNAASIAFTAPSIAPANTPTVYKAVSSPSSITGFGSRSPVVVEGLAANTAYTYTVQAVNNAGTTVSSASSSLTATPPSYESIATVVVGAGGQSAITFNSIPQTYSHLQVRAFAKTGRTVYGNDSMSMTFNGSNTGYWWAQMTGEGSGPSATGNANSGAFLGGWTGASASASTFAPVVIDIIDYADTNKAKTIKSLSGVDINGTVAGVGGTLGMFSGCWFNTAGVTSINFNSNSGTNFVQYTHFALYGIR